MPEDVNTDVVATPGSAQDPLPPLGAAGGEGGAGEAAQAAAGAEPKVVTIPTASMRRIKGEEYARGKQSALEELAKGAGFESHVDLVAALSKLKGAPAAPAATPAPVAPAKPQADLEAEDPAKDLAQAKDARREEGRYQRQMEKVLNERNKYAQSAQDWQRKARESQAEADAVRAEMHLRTIAAGVGVQDIDYAITLFSREVEKMTPEQAEKFDEKAFFDGLRKVKPLLFGESVVPATTGTGVGGAPTPPKPGQVAAQNGANGRVNAKELNTRDYNALLAKRGINPIGA